MKVQVVAWYCTVTMTGGLVAFSACGGETASDESSGTTDGGTTTSASSSSSTSSSGGDGSPNDGATPDQDSSVPGGANCTNDADCNFDSGMSSLAGQCIEGLCFCKSGFHVQPNGKCGAAMPPTCTEQSGGTCVQGASTCSAGQLAGDQSTNASCGDFVAATCCFAATSCKGSTDVVCCSKATGKTAPICVNGWRTCNDGESPGKKADICN